MIIDPKIFKDYDIRATLPAQIDEDGILHLGYALASYFKPKKVSVGRDMRLSSDLFFNQLAKALTSKGIDVIDLGLITTDMSYFASATQDVDLSLMITASHNPAADNGLKIVKRDAIPVSGEKGIYDIRDMITDGKVDTSLSNTKGSITKVDIWDTWIKHVLSFIDIPKINPLNILVDAGNGMAGQILGKIATFLPCKITPMYFELDGSFPNHLAYPLLQETTDELRERVVAEGFDLGAAWDGDADRVFFIDNQGKFVDGTTLGALLSDYLLPKSENKTVIYNAVIGRVVKEIVESHGGVAIRWKVGHTLLKEKMRIENGLLAVEHSGHFFYHDNHHCDSGIITFLLGIEILSQSGQKFSDFLTKYRRHRPSGEINFKVEDKGKVLSALDEKYASLADSTDKLDGYTVWYKDWWFNVRPSNTQPLLRLNVEVNDPKLDINKKVEELVSFIETQGGSMVKE